MPDEDEGIGASSVAITSDDVGPYGLKLLAEDNTLTLVKYSREARKRGTEGVEVEFDQRLGLLVAKALEAFTKGNEFTPLHEQHPNDRDILVCPTCAHNGAFDGQGHDRKGRYISRCPQCDTTIHQPP